MAAGGSKNKLAAIVSSPFFEETRIALAAEVDRKARLCACELGIPGSRFRASEGLASLTSCLRIFVRNAARTDPTTAKRVEGSALFLKRTRAVVAETVHFVALLIESRAAAWRWWWRWRPEGPGAEAEAEAATG